MPATTWTEASVSAEADWQTGVPSPVVVTADLVGDPWITQALFENFATTFTENSVAASSWSENSVSATTWTETT